MHTQWTPFKYIPTFIISSQDITLIFHTETIPIHTHLHLRLYTKIKTQNHILKHIGDLSTIQIPLYTAHSLSKKCKNSYDSNFVYYTTDLDNNNIPIPSKMYIHVFYFQKKWHSNKVTLLLPKKISDMAMNP